MKWNKPGWLWLLAILSLALTLPVMRWRGEANENFTCQANLVVTQNHFTYDGLLEFSFENGVGRYEAKGIYRSEDNKAVKVQHSLPFHYWRKDDSMILVSDVDTLTSMDVRQTISVPDFFRIRGRGITFQLETLNAGSVMFLENNVPVLVCKKTL